MLQYIESYLWYKKIIKIIKITLQISKLTPRQIAIVEANLPKAEIMAWYQDCHTYNQQGKRKIRIQSLLDGIMSRVNMSLNIPQIDKQKREKIIESLYELLDETIEKTNKEQGRIGVIPPDNDN